MIRQELKDFRRKKGLSQREMAEIWGVTLSFYSKIEYGLKAPSLQKIKEFKENFKDANIDKIFLT